MKEVRWSVEPDKSGALKVTIQFDNGMQGERLAGRVDVDEQGVRTEAWVGEGR